MTHFQPAQYHWPDIFRFRHVKPGYVFKVRPEHATASVEPGYYIRATARKALPCQYSEFGGEPHVAADSGVRYIPSNLPVEQTWV